MVWAVRRLAASDVILLLTRACGSAQDGSASGREHMQLLYSFLSSLLKLGSVSMAPPASTEGSELSVDCASYCCFGVALAVSNLAASCSCTTNSAAPDPAAGVPAGSGSSSATVQSQQSDAAAQASSVSMLLPSLPLRGRCCLQMAQQLQPVGGSSDSADDTEVAAASFDGSSIKGSVLLEQVGMMQAFMQWLSLPSVAQQLSAAGYQPQQLQQGLQDLVAALQTAATAAETDSQAPQFLAALVQQLTAAGHMLCSVAVPEMCNNPACANLSGPSDIALVSGRSCLCAGCVTARYCGRACQVAHWKAHRPVCTVLKAAAAAAAAAAASAGGSQAV